jgi:hypothetical protein
MRHVIVWFGVAAGSQDRRAGATAGLDHDLNGQPFAEGSEIRLDGPRSAERLMYRRAK